MLRRVGIKNTISNVWLEYEFFGVYINWNIPDYMAGGYPGYGLCYLGQILLLIVMIMVSLMITCCQYNVKKGWNQKYHC